LTDGSRRDFVRASLASGAALLLPSALVAEQRAATARFDAVDSIAIRDITLFDARTKRNRPHQTVLISGDRITAVGPASELAVPTGARVIEGRSRFLIPGLIDAHVHLTHILYQAGVTGDEVLPLFVQHGVTSVRGTGDNVPAQALLKRWAGANPTKSPRIFLGSGLIDGSPPWHQDVGWSITDPAAVPAYVAQMKQWDVTTLKIYVGTERAVGQRVIEEGHRQGFVVAGHLARYTTPDAVADGIDSLEHIFTVADFARDVADDRHSFDPRSDATKRLVDLIAARGTAVDPTLMVFWGTLFFVDVPAVVEHPDNLLVPKRLRDYWLSDNPRRLLGAASGPLAIRERTFARYQELVGMLHRAGVPILVGTDAPEPQVTPGASLHHEMELMVASGMSAADVLSAATQGNARLLKEEGRLGVIEPGMAADLVVLDADPLADIRNSRRISGVLRSGVAIDS